MDQVPYDFCERVAACCKCCKDESCESSKRCYGRQVTDCQWITKRQAKVCFYIGNDYGKWKYTLMKRGLTDDDDDCMTLDQLMEHRSLKDVRICKIIVYEMSSQSTVNRYSNTTPLDVDMERLMKFVAHLSNEPELELLTKTIELFNSPEGSTLLKFLSKMTFRSILIEHCSQVHCQLLENQFLGRKPTQFNVRNLENQDNVVSEHLSNGNIRRFHGRYAHFTAEVMDGIIGSFLANPQKLNINAYFRKSTKALLDRKLDAGLCKLDANGDYCFEVYNSNLQKHQGVCIRQNTTFENWWCVYMSTN